MWLLNKLQNKGPRKNEPNPIEVLSGNTRLTKGSQGDTIAEISLVRIRSDLFDLQTVRKVGALSSHRNNKILIFSAKLILFVLFANKED